MNEHLLPAPGCRRHPQRGVPLTLCCRLAIGVLAAGLVGCAKPADHPEIRAVLDRQAAAWTKGDLDGFMAEYWQSDDLVFRSPRGETRGWTAVRDRYRQAYPTPAEMGRLSFDIAHIAETAPDAAEVAGRFHQDLPAGKQSGRIYLHLRRFDGKWLIVSDLTTPD
jgi:uncharacterized protein (TIGR02246 family)